MTNGATFNIPFPALTTDQRYHFEVNGYVVIEDVLNPMEIKLLYDVLHELKAEFMSYDDPWNTSIRGATITGKDEYDHRVFFNNMIESHPAFLEHVSHNRIVGMAEEVIGQRVRLTEHNAYINSRNFDNPYQGPGRYQWHRNRPGAMTYTDNGLFHCNFVKSITNLTDLGPDDGGTSVIAGSHKVAAPEEGIVKAARNNPDLIHSVVAPAGSTLIFSETLLHATGDILSDRERTIIINGYMPWNHINETENNFTDDFKSKVPDLLKPLLFGSYLNPRLRRRSLGDEVGLSDPGNYLDGWSLSSPDPDSYEIVDVSRRNQADVD
tara:strand:- start:71 stop:1039 length:969 start_codon:yes stop_codon:yes gene_type:complete